LMCKESVCEDGFAAGHEDPRHLLPGTFKVEVTCSHSLNVSNSLCQSKIQ